MDQTQADATKEKLLAEFNAVVDETEQLLKSVANAGSERAGALMANVEQGLAAASDRLAKLRDQSVGQANAAARVTDEYVQGNPWRAVGIVAAASAIAGLLAGLLISRR